MVDTSKILQSFKNGNYTLELFDNGMKRRSVDENFEGSLEPESPESIDVKITDYCDRACKYCHEKSTLSGKHSDLNYLFELLFNSNIKGIELAIGGGNPLSHPDLLNQFRRIKAEFGDKVILNITVNSFHLRNPLMFSVLETLITEGLVKGVGISITCDIEYISSQLSRLTSLTENLVYHLIAGYNNIDVIPSLSLFSKKILVLGYKEVGRGKSYKELRNAEVDENINQWYMFIAKYFDENLISFDNLAVKQLNVKRFFTDEEFNKFFMGEDGTFTFYIDLVKQEFAKSSTSNIRTPIANMNIKEMFQLTK